MSACARVCVCLCVGVRKLRLSSKAGWDCIHNIQHVLNGLRPNQSTPVVAKIFTNAKRCPPWSRPFHFPEDGLIYDLSQWDCLARLWQ